MWDWTGAEDQGLSPVRDGPTCPLRGKSVAKGYLRDLTCRGKGTRRELTWPRGLRLRFWATSLPVHGLI